MTTLKEYIWLHPKLEWFFNIYYKLMGLIERTKRSFAYAKLGWNNYDFDALTIERYLLFKLKRVEHALINGHYDLTLEHGPIKMKALRLAIRLLERLNGHYTRFHNMHEIKWGKLVIKTEPVENEKYYHMLFNRPNANTPDLIEQEREEFLAAVYADDREEARDRKIVYNILNKYITYWWE